MRNILVTGPSVEPVSVSELKLFMRYPNDTTEEDELISTIIEGARTYFEEHTQLALISQTWKLSLDKIPSQLSPDEWWDGVRDGSIAMFSEPQRYIELPKSPLISVTTFESFDEEDTATAFTDFYTNAGTRPGRLSLRNGSVWPIASRGVNNFEITYVAGFGSAASNVPADIRMAIRQIAAHWYENRDLLSFDFAGREVPAQAMNVLRKRKVMKL